METQAPQIPGWGWRQPQPATTPPGSSAATTRARTGDTRSRTPVPGFLLDRGRFTGFDAPRASIETARTASTTATGLSVLGSGENAYLHPFGFRGPASPSGGPGAPGDTDS